ncbi:FecR family protein [Reyranella sp.]|uniref:FecR family protein n=1 Tax=Reyranella sp. TaxID=1929291 RepID=UPI003BA86A5C
MEATRWLVELHESPGDREIRRRFDAWRRASPLNAAAWAETEQVSALATGMTPAYEPVWEPVVAGRPRGRPTSTVPGRFAAFLRPGRVGLAVTALAACIAVFVVPPIVQRLGADYATSTAELRSVVLPDGSEATLAPDSALAVAFDGDARRVRLLVGEAFFDVRPDRSRPFRVLAREVETVVVGTRFDVEMSDDGVRVSVERGAVRVGSEELQPGQAVHVAPGGRVSRAETSPDMVAAWRDGQLVARNVPLRTAVDQLRRYYGGSILLTDSALGDRRITGAYNLADPEDALRAIAQAHGGRVRRITPWLLIVSAS